MANVNNVMVKAHATLAGIAARETSSGFLAVMKTAKENRGWWRIN
jgi:hypothetical protein